METTSHLISASVLEIPYHQSIISSYLENDEIKNFAEHFKNKDNILKQYYIYEVDCKDILKYFKDENFRIKIHKQYKKLVLM